MALEARRILSGRKM